MPKSALFLWGLTLTCAVQAAPAASTLEASLDLRPSWSSVQGTVHSENEGAFAYWLSPDVSLGYVQEFHTGHLADGVDLHAGDGYVRGQKSQLLPGVDYTLRVYLPTKLSERDAGRITALRQHFYVPLAVNGWLTLSFTEIPIAHFFSRDTDPEGKSNARLENRTEWAMEFVLLKERLRAKLPLIVQNVYHRDSSWSHVVWVNPEAIFAIAEKTGVGLAYYSQPLNQDGFSKAIEHGIFQVVFQQAI